MFQDGEVYGERERVVGWANPRRQPLESKPGVAILAILIGNRRILGFPMPTRFSALRSEICGAWEEWQVSNDVDPRSPGAAA